MKSLALDSPIAPNFASPIAPTLPGTASRTATRGGRQGGRDESTIWPPRVEGRRLDYRKRPERARGSFPIQSERSRPTRRFGSFSRPSFRILRKSSRPRIRLMSQSRPNRHALARFPIVLVRPPFEAEFTTCGRNRPSAPKAFLIPDAPKVGQAGPSPERSQMQTRATWVSWRDFRTKPIANPCSLGKLGEFPNEANRQPVRPGQAGPFPERSQSRTGVAWVNLRNYRTKPITNRRDLGKLAHLPNEANCKPAWPG